MIKAKIQINYRDKTLEMDTYKMEFDNMVRSNYGGTYIEPNTEEENLNQYITKLGTTDRLTEVGGLGVFIPASQIVSVHYMILED